MQSVVCPKQGNQVLLADLFGDIVPDSVLIRDRGIEGMIAVQLSELNLFLMGPRILKVALVTLARFELPSDSASLRIEDKPFDRSIQHCITSARIRASILGNAPSSASPHFTLLLPPGGLPQSGRNMSCFVPMAVMRNDLPAAQVPLRGRESRIQ